jgi:thiamine pyrophosphokinase
MICKIVGGSKDSFSKLYEKDENEYIIGLDSGTFLLNKLGIKVDLAIGDFDSVDINDIKADKVIVYPKDKDYSDLELALMEIKDDKFSKVLVYNALDLNNKVYLINKDTKFKKSDYKYISFFSQNAYITLEGFKYNLVNYHLTSNDNLCLSNEIKEDAIIKTKDLVLVIESK